MIYNIDILLPIKSMIRLKKIKIKTKLAKLIIYISTELGFLVIFYRVN